MGIIAVWLIYVMMLLFLLFCMLCLWCCEFIFEFSFKVTDFD